MYNDSYYSTVVHPIYHVTTIVLHPFYDFATTAGVYIYIYIYIALVLYPICDVTRVVVCQNNSTSYL